MNYEPMWNHTHDNLRCAVTNNNPITDQIRKQNMNLVSDSDSDDAHNRSCVLGTGIYTARQQQFTHVWDKMCPKSLGRYALPINQFQWQLIRIRYLQKSRLSMRSSPRYHVRHVLFPLLVVECFLRPTNFLTIKQIM